MQSFEAAARAWRDVLGEQNVAEDRKTLGEAETATFKSHQTIPLILRPGNREEIQSCLKIATEFRVPVFPASAGKNWGLGSRLPVRSDTVLMDLSRLNRITAYDEKLAYVTVEAGVTQRQLYEFLREVGSRLMVAVTGSTPDSTIVGNTMERGHAKGPYGDRFSFVCGFEVVLPTGECVHTGFGRFNKSKAAPVAKWGVGPSLDGLFSQSNMGVVTEMTLWLQPMPEVFQTVFFGVNDVARLPALVDRLRELRVGGALRSSIVLLNDYRVQSELGQYPWDEMQGQTPLSRNVLDAMKRRNTGMPVWSGQWNGEVAIYSMGPEQAKADRAVVERYLEPYVDSLAFREETRETIEAWISRISLAGTHRIDRKRINYCDARTLGFLGVPVVGSIPITYWRKKIPVPQEMHPDHDGCGIIWCSPTVPFTGEDVESAVRILSDTLTEYGFEPNLCLNCVSERSIDITAAILFDRSRPGDDTAANLCYEKMLDRLGSRGYVPYRLTVHSMGSLRDPKDDFAKVTGTIKRALDPSGILSPGRYER